MILVRARCARKNPSHPCYARAPATAARFQFPAMPMEYRPLGPTPLRVSVLGLGTMTFGEQNSLAEAHAQLDLALDSGVNFIDTAEMYPIPARGETQGRTESYIGEWLARRGVRDKVVLATKVAGPASWLAHLRGGGARLDRRNVLAAIDASLARLRTDYVDLYQVHWPDRETNFFGKLGYAPGDDSASVPIDETLDALGELVRAGKARYVGVSNETPWGVMHYLQRAATGAPRIVSIQNPYNLLNRSFEIGLSEIAHRERVPLLAYSPLGFGTLTGKYLHGARPAGSRMERFTRYRRYTTPEGERACAQYVALANERGLDPAQLAIAFVASRPFVASVLVGATSVAQLRTNLAAAALVLDGDTRAAIEAVHTRQPNPCP